MKNKYSNFVKEIADSAECFMELSTHIVNSVHHLDKSIDAFDNKIDYMLEKDKQRRKAARQMKKEERAAKKERKKGAGSILKKSSKFKKTNVNSAFIADEYERFEEMFFNKEEM